MADDVEAEVTPADTGEVFIQWKGTDACIDLRCKCGETGHFDGFFAYFVKCPKCGAVYKMPELLTLTEVPEGEDAEPMQVVQIECDV